MTPISLNNQIKAARNIKAKDYLYYSESRELTKDVVALRNIFLVLKFAGNNVSLWSLGGDTNNKTLDELINNEYWFHVPFPTDLL